MTNSQKVVIPAKAGIHLDYNYLKNLDSRFHGNDKNTVFRTFYETINKWLDYPKIPDTQATNGSVYIIRRIIRVKYR